jgi:hypothetical protein
MIVNFEVIDFYALFYNGKQLDVHNNFDFIGYEYKISGRELILKWIKSDGNWIKEDEFSKLTLIHSNVSFLNVSYDNKDYEFPENDICLSEVTFFPSALRMTNNKFIDQRKPNENDDIIYTFQSGHFIRVCCESVELKAN